MSEYIRGLTHALMVVLMVAGLSACDRAKSKNQTISASAQSAALVSSSSSTAVYSSSGDVSLDSFSSAYAFHIDLWFCPEGFNPPASPLHVCNSRVPYTGGYAPDEKCSGGLLVQGTCFQPNHACSWGLDTEVCKSALSSAAAESSSSLASSTSSSTSSFTVLDLQCPQDYQFAPSTLREQYYCLSYKPLADFGELEACGDGGVSISAVCFVPLQTSDSSSVSSVEVIINENATCEAFEQSAQWYDYYTISLQDVTRSDPSIIKGLWRVSFNKGQITLVDGDTVINGTYTCLGNQVTATYALTAGLEEHIIELKHEGGVALEFDPYGKGLTAYGTGDKFSAPSADCAKVKGRRYIGNEDDRLTADFASTTNSVTYTNFDGIERQGFYTCDAGSLGIYASGDYAAFISIYGNGSMIFFGKHSLSEVPVACTANYDPVCGVTETEIQCITAPCPSPLKNYKTFSNSCAAFAGHAEIIAQGECGDLEGQAYSSSSSADVLN